MEVENAMHECGNTRRSSWIKWLGVEYRVLVHVERFELSIKRVAFLHVAFLHAERLRKSVSCVFAHIVFGLEYFASLFSSSHNGG